MKASCISGLRWNFKEDMPGGREKAQGEGDGREEVYAQPERNALIFLIIRFQGAIDIGISHSLSSQA
jgi:hypothetical protein